MTIATTSLPTSQDAMMALRLRHGHEALARDLNRRYPNLPGAKRERVVRAWLRVFVASNGWEGARRCFGDDERAACAHGLPHACALPEGHSPRHVCGDCAAVF